MLAEKKRENVQSYSPMFQPRFEPRSYHMIFPFWPTYIQPFSCFLCHRVVALCLLHICSTLGSSVIYLYVLIPKVNKSLHVQGRVFQQHLNNVSSIAVFVFIISPNSLPTSSYFWDLRNRFDLCKLPIQPRLSNGGTVRLRLSNKPPTYVWLLDGGCSCNLNRDSC